MADPPRGVETTAHPAVAERDAASAPPHEGSVTADAPRARPSGAAAEREQSPWADIADRGTAVGRKSKDAGLATAGFFTRVGRRVAGSF